MTKTVIKFKDDSFINIEADNIELEKGKLLVKKREKLVAVIKLNEVISCHISEKN